jgi:hypothetical protein
MGAIIFHGLWRGLGVLIATAPCAATLPAPDPELRPRSAPIAVHDRQLVRMLANMVLAAETGGAHVY